MIELEEEEEEEEVEGGEYKTRVDQAAAASIPACTSAGQREQEEKETA